MAIPRDDDLDYVRRQLDDLSIARALCMATPEDQIRYAELCDRETALLQLDRRRRLGVLTGSMA